MCCCFDIIIFPINIICLPFLQVTDLRSPSDVWPYLWRKACHSPDRVACIIVPGAVLQATRSLLRRHHPPQRCKHVDVGRCSPLKIFHCTSHTFSSLSLSGGSTTDLLVVYHGIFRFKLNAAGSRGIRSDTP